MKFSIIIPCHNVESYIGYCLDTILSQTYKDFEIICICDNCTDETRLMIEQKADSRISIFDTQFGCAGLPRNLGIDNAQGEWIWFVDADDWIITPYALQEISDIIDIAYDIDIINFNFLWNNQVKGVLGNNGKLWCNVWSRIFKRDAIGNIRFNDKQIADDLDFFVAVYEKQGKIYDSNKTLYYYNNPRIGSLTYNAL